MKSNATKSLRSRLISPDVSILSLDALRPTQKLVPGVALALAPGVTISVLQDAAEGLLEIESSAANSTYVDEKPTSELATVESGQIIKTSQGRFVMVRHLQAIIVPRIKGAKRSASLQQTIQLAVASVAGDVSETPKAVQKPTQRPSVRNVIRVALACSVLLIGYNLATSTDETSVAKEQTAIRPTPASKSRIIGLSNQLEEVADPAIVTTPSVPAPSNSSPVAITKAETPEVVPPTPVQPVKVKSQKTSQDARSSLIKLTEKDQQTIMEYKLEARFDRANARAKMDHFAKSFPPGSPARSEVERAGRGM